MKKKKTKLSKKRKAKTDRDDIRKEVNKLVKKVQAAATGKNFLCRIGFHKYEFLLEYGFIFSLTQHFACTRCGKHIKRMPVNEAY